MLPEEESAFRECIDRLLVEKYITNARLLALGLAVDNLAKEIGVQWQAGLSTSAYVKTEAVRLVNEKLRYMADDDPNGASVLRCLLDEYEKS